MKTIDELNRIKLANTIINRGSNRLGVKPMYVGNLISLDKRESKELHEIANKLSASQARHRRRFFNPTSLVSAFCFVLAVIIIYSSIFVFNPVEVNTDTAKLKASTQATNKKPQALNKKITKLDERKPITGIVTNNKNLAITSGTFKSVSQADRFKKELKERLGVPLKIVRDRNFYTVQIGPSYQNHEDALIVFDELSRYSVRNLSLRFEAP